MFIEKMYLYISIYVYICVYISINISLYEKMWHKHSLRETEGQKARMRQQNFLSYDYEFHS